MALPPTSIKCASDDTNSSIDSPIDSILLLFTIIDFPTELLIHHPWFAANQCCERWFAWLGDEVRVEEQSHAGWSMDEGKWTIGIESTAHTFSFGLVDPNGIPYPSVGDTIKP